MSKCIPDINFVNVTEGNVRKLVHAFMMKYGVKIDNTGDIDENCKEYVKMYLIKFCGKDFTEVNKIFKEMEDNPSKQYGFTTIQLLYDPENPINSENVYEHPNPIFMPFVYRMKDGEVIDPEYKSKSFDIFRRIKENMENNNYTFTAIDDYKFREAVSEIYRSSTISFNIIKQ